MTVSEGVSDEIVVEQVRARFGQFGFVAKCSSVPLPPDGHWLMVYENPFASLRERYFLGVFAGATEMYRLPFGSDLSARKEFERRVDAGANA